MATVSEVTLYKGPTIRDGCWEFTASDAAAGALFGRSVAIDGDTIVIGAYGDASLGVNTGAAYVYERAGGTWTETQKLVGSNAGDQFGWAVAVNQGTIVVGAPFEWIGGVQEVGATYVYTKVGGTWTLQQKLEGNPTADWPRYGSSVAIDGDWLITGSQQGNLTGLDKGGAHGWLRSAGVWTKHEFPTDMIGVDNWFGTSVALDVAAGWAIVSEPGAKGTSGGVRAGKVHVFKLIGSDWVYNSPLMDGSYTPNTYLGGGSDHLFTECVAIRGNYAFVSKPRPSSLWQFNYIFVFKYHVGIIYSGIWTLSQVVKMKSGITADNTTGDRHGSSICVVDDRTLLVGAPYQVWWDGAVRRTTGMGAVYYTDNGWEGSGFAPYEFHDSLIYEQPPETGVGLGWSVSADSTRQLLLGKPFVNSSAGSAVLLPEASTGVPAPIPDGYLMQATDSVTGALYHWTSETRDMAAAGYPGPNEAVDVAVNGFVKSPGRPV
jgi:hypothetical protein